MLIYGTIYVTLCQVHLVKKRKEITVLLSKKSTKRKVPKAITLKIAFDGRKPLPKEIADLLVNTGVTSIHCHTNSPKMYRDTFYLPYLPSAGRDDGGLTIQELIDNAVEDSEKLTGGVKVKKIFLSITPHNMVYPIEIWNTINIPENVEVRLGMEVEVNFDGDLRDILVYFDDLEKFMASDFYQHYEKHVVIPAPEWENDNCDTLKRACAKYGFVEPLADVPRNCYELGWGRPNDVVAKAIQKHVFEDENTPYTEFKDYLLSAGYIPTDKKFKKSFYTEFVMNSKNEDFYCNPHVTERMALDEFLKAIDGIASLVIVAHPYKYEPKIDCMINYLDGIKEAISRITPNLIWGVEIIHSGCNEEIRNALREYVAENSIAYTVSSDFHEYKKGVCSMFVAGSENTIVLTPEMVSSEYYAITPFNNKK